MLLEWFIYLKSHIHEKKNKKGLIHFLLSDIEWQQKQNYIEIYFFRHLLNF